MKGIKEDSVKKSSLSINVIELKKKKVKWIEIVIKFEINLNEF